MDCSVLVQYSQLAQPPSDKVGHKPPSLRHTTRHQCLHCPETHACGFSSGLDIPGCGSQRGTSQSRAFQIPANSDAPAFQITVNLWKGSTQAFGNFSQLSCWVGERMGQNRGHSQHLCCSHWKLNSEDAYYIIWNIISVLSENSTDHLVFLLLLLILANVYLLQCFIQDLSRILLQIAIMNTPNTSDWLKAASRFFMWTVHLHTVPSHIFQAMERCLYSRPLLHAYWQHAAALCHSDRRRIPHPRNSQWQYWPWWFPKGCYSMPLP